MTSLHISFNLQINKTKQYLLQYNTTLNYEQTFSSSPSNTMYTPPTVNNLLSFDRRRNLGCFAALFVESNFPHKK